MKFTNFSNDQLHRQTQITADKERLTTIELLWHLRENEKRLLYAQMGYRDLKEYCVKELKLSEGSAWRRINGMRALQELPEVEEKIQSGDLNLTQIALARSLFREVKASTSEKQEILLSLVNQSTRTTERILAEKNPEGYIKKPDVIEKPLRGQKLEVTLVLDEQFQSELEEIQILLGKPYSKLELFKMLAQEKLEALKKNLSKKIPEKMRTSKIIIEHSTNMTAADSDFSDLIQCDAQPARTGTSKQIQTVEHSQCNSKSKKSRYISQYTLSVLANRNQHQCQFIDPVTKRRCSARFYLQTEHIYPFAKGGSNKIENLQKLCANHNRLQAIRHFGVHQMQAYLPLLK